MTPVEEAEPAAELPQGEEEDIEVKAVEPETASAAAEEGAGEPHLPNTWGPCPPGHVSWSLDEPGAAVTPRRIYHKRHRINTQPFWTRFFVKLDSSTAEMSPSHEKGRRWNGLVEKSGRKTGRSGFATRSR